MTDDPVAEVALAKMEAEMRRLGQSESYIRAELTKAAAMMKLFGTPPKPAALCVSGERRAA